MRNDGMLRFLDRPPPNRAPHRYPHWPSQARDPRPLPRRPRLPHAFAAPCAIRRHGAQLLIGGLLAFAALQTAVAAPPARTDPSAADPHATHRAAMSAASGASPTSVVLPGTRLRMRDGRGQRLDAQAFGDRIVVADFVFTHCTTICPALTAIMASVQKRLSRDGSDDWLLLSLSVDPARDTPARMDYYAAKVGAGEHWWWLTGDSTEVDRSLRAFGLMPGRPEDHAPMLLVGHPASGRWLRWVGMPDPERVSAAVRDLRADVAAARLASVEEAEPHAAK